MEGGSSLVGKYHVEVSSKRNKYVFDVKRKYTFILGDSGTGKTKLGVLLKRSRKAGGNRIHVNCNVPVILIEDVEMMEKFYTDEKDTKAIYVIDEDVIDELTSKDNGVSFANNTKGMSAYFVLLTRNKLGALPYSPLEIYEFKGRIVGDCCLRKTVNVYEWKDLLPINADVVIVEDSKVGYYFFKETLNCIVESAYGDGNLQNMLKEKIVEGYKSIVLIGDDAAIGCSIRKLMDIVQVNVDVNVYLFFPESFEYLVLKANIFSQDISQELLETYNYAETSEFFSWERYYTHLLGIVSNSRGGYRKESKYLPKYLISEINVDRIYSVIREISRC